MQPVFPPQESYARAFYGEAVRHLADARALYRAERYAGCMASAMKAAELAVKSALILDHAMWSMDRIFGTHKPLTEAEGHPLFKRLISLLDAHQFQLSVDVRKLESLEPRAFDKKALNFGEQRNTEYPFLDQSADAFGNPIALLRSPHAEFTDSDARSNWQVAYDLCTALAALYPDIARWKVRLPNRL